MPGEVTEEVVIIVKAVPQLFERYGETVCCAGITRIGEWRSFSWLPTSCGRTWKRADASHTEGKRGAL